MNEMDDELTKYVTNMNYLQTKPYIKIDTHIPATCTTHQVFGGHSIRYNQA